MDLLLIGKALKDKRIQLNLSIRDLANTCHIAPSTISLIENGKTSPNLLTLKAICDALNIPVFSLLLEDSEDSIRLVRKEDQKAVTRNMSNGLPLTEHLLIGGKNEMYAAIVEVPAHTNSGQYAHHGGEEFVFILKGDLIYDLEGRKRYELHPYDTLYYPNYIGHRWENNTEEDGEIMLVSTSPYQF